MGALTESLVSFIADADAHTLPDGAEDVVRTGFCDTVGVMIAGLSEPVFSTLLAAVAARGGKPEARVALGGRRAGAPDAALVGAATAHALDYDDYAYSNHVSAVLVPAILAEGEHVGATGAGMVRAYVVGYEVWREIMKREPGHLYDRGWHPTAVFGAFGAAAAAASLHGLDADTVRNAIGLCVAHGGGVMANFGTMAKPYQGGRAAQAGLSAVRLAMAGVEAGPHALDGKDGYLLGLSPERDADVTRPADRLGRDWGIVAERLNVKRYPIVGAAQRGADCAIQLHDTGIDIGEIERIRYCFSERHARVMPFRKPQTGLEAKFSAEFTAAAGLIAGALGFDQLEDSFVQRPDVQVLMDRVERTVGPDDDPVYASGARADIVHLELKDGSTVSSREVTRWRGHAENPMTTDELKAKFMDCASRQLEPAAAAALFELLHDIADLPSCDALPVVTPRG